LPPQSIPFHLMRCDAIRAIPFRLALAGVTRNVDTAVKFDGVQCLLRVLPPWNDGPACCFFSSKDILFQESDTTYAEICAKGVTQIKSRAIFDREFFSHKSSDFLHADFSSSDIWISRLTQMYWMYSYILPISLSYVFYYCLRDKTGQG
jgi:hypothetical protein